MTRTFLAFLLLLSSALAQTASSSPIFVDVLNKKTGVQIEGLTAENFRVTLDGKRLKVQSAERENLRLHIAVLLDTSGSMSAGRKWDAAFDMTEATIRLLLPNEISVVVFSDRRHTMWSFEGADLALKGLENLRRMRAKIPAEQGRTALWDTMAMALSALKLQNGDAVVLISDGGDNSSAISSYASVEKKVRQSGVRVFGISVGEDELKSPEELEGTLGFHQLIDISGGAGVWYGRTYMGSDFRLLTGQQGHLAEFANYIALRVLRPYILSLELPVNAHGRLKVELTDTTTTRAKDVQVAARDRIVDPTSASAGR